MSDDKTADAINDGKRAHLLLNDELLNKAFATLERDYIGFWKTTPARDTDARERLWHGVQAVGKLRDHLVAVMNNGKLALADLEARENDRA